MFVKVGTKSLLSLEPYAHAFAPIGVVCSSWDSWDAQSLQSVPSKSESMSMSVSPTRCGGSGRDERDRD